VIERPRSFRASGGTRAKANGNLKRPSHAWQRRLRHLGIEPGDKVSIDLLPGGTATLTGVKANSGVERFFGMLHDPDQPPLSLEEIDQAIVDGWAGIRRKGKSRA
jgi:hypothetical protein